MQTLASQDARVGDFSVEAQANFSRVLDQEVSFDPAHTTLSALSSLADAMILYKTIALRLGKNLDNEQPANMRGTDGQPVLSEEVRQHWREVLSDLASARIYLLDHNAANYLDSLRMGIQGMPWENRSESDIQGYVRDVDLPRDLIWIEYDDRKLWEDRAVRGITALNEDELSNRHQRGFLFDNRSSDKLTVRLYSAMTDTIFLDAPFLLTISKSQDGRHDFNNVSWQPERVVIAGLMRTGLLTDKDSFVEHFEEYKGHLTYEMVIGFMLFAALAAREDDLLATEVSSLSSSQIKTARKFNKVWMTETLKSHVTIRIGPAAERHLTEQKARLRFEEAHATSRNTPTEHWVAEHERRYSNGKVVRVRAHKRGQSPNRSVPARVVGPKAQG
ncbi:hypothetical protein [Roseobacter ponti]|uniref:Uncharacterized protein n=1 Tax=Roseobacter ponti TaxID=1891787 RepID=A0A858SRZ1_9RHOB|nr:hypothetical protein [Roseobacter ponti]QJF51090.1 hypothetical protein G3256_07915 [Roseobacter ponti]